MKWIDSTNLNQWADSREAQALLPQLIRRLILAFHAPQSLTLPSGDAVWLPGYDGILETTESSLYVPAGKSVWECGCDSNPKSKANKDYAKRSKEPLDMIPSKTKYIFITPRIFKNKEEWVEEKKAEGIWEDVYAYDATDLECWVEQAPAVGAWLAKQLGVFTADITSADDIKDDWSCISTPSINIKIVLAGRARETAALTLWLNKDPSSQTVQAPTKREAVLFLIAVASQMPQEQTDEFFSRCVIASSPDAFRQLVLSKHPLILIPSFETDGSMFLRAAQAGHHVFIPLDPTNTANDSQLILSRLDRDGFVSCLKESGLSDEGADELNRETGRSLSVLERKISGMSAQPLWAQAPSIHQFIPILLAGRWAESSPKDTDVLAQISGTDYPSVQQLCTDLAAQPDAPVCNIGANWRLISPVDAWFAAASFITSHELDSFKQLVIDVLSERNPVLDLDEDKRFMASVYGKVPPYSKLLREGLCQTLTLVAVYGEGSLTCISTPQQWVDGIVRELLHEASTDRWFSLAHIIRFLAEASPLAFMDAVEHSLQSESLEIMSLFEDAGDMFTSGSHHVDILWALEMIAWEPEYLSRASLLLAKLARRDTGTRSANRPANSLLAIFLLWKPQTSSSFDQQKDVLEHLIAREPEIGWRLLLKLLPDHHSHTSPTHRSRWRELNTHEPIISRIDYYKHGIVILDMLLAHVELDGARWAELLNEAQTLPSEYSRALDQLDICLDKALTDRSALWAKIRGILHRHRTYRDADWVIHKVLLERLDSIYHRIAPEGVHENNYWLFTSGGPAFPDGNSFDDYDAHEKKRQAARLSAVEQIFMAGGIEAIIEFSQNVEVPSYVGGALASISLGQKDESTMFTSLLAENLTLRSLLDGYIRSKSFNNPEWTSKHCKQIQSENWSSEKTANFFLSLPQNTSTWNMLETLGEDADNSYWKIFNDRIHPKDVDAYPYAITKLLDAKRPAVTLNLIWMGAEKLSTKQITDILLALLENPPSEEERGRINSHEVTELFKTLSTRSDIEKDLHLQLEWAYLPILSSVGSQFDPVALCREMTSNPSFFAEVISYVYKSDNEEPIEALPPDDKKIMLADHGHDLLESWDITPGSINNDKDVDFEELLKWTLETRKLCREIGRLKVCDIQIGHVLSKTPQDKEATTWPPEYVCQLIDTIESEDITHGFEVQVYNNRGTTTRGMSEGGRQERALVEKYKNWSKQLATKYPRTAACLNSIADSYECDAKRQDQSSEWNSLEF